MSAEVAKKNRRMNAAPLSEVVAPARHSEAIRGSVADGTRNPAPFVSSEPAAQVSPRTVAHVESWTRTTLGTLAGGRGKTISPAKTPHQKFELYSVPSFPRGQPEIVTGDVVGSSKQLVEPRTLLLSKINPRINRAWVVGNFTTHQKIASTEWITFPPSQEVVPEFLCYFLQQNEVRDFLARNASGVGGSLMRVKPATLRDFPFAYPPLEHQREIVAEIEKQFTRLDAGVATLRRMQANLKRYRAAVLKAACEGRLVPTEAELAKAEGRTYETGEQLLARILADRRKNWNGRGKYKEPAAPDTTNLLPPPEGWTWTNIGQLAEVGTGATPAKGNSEFYADGTIPWVTSGAVNSPRIECADQFVTTTALEKCNLTLYPPGTLLLAMYGEGKTRGMASELMFSATTNQALAAIEVPEKLLNFVKVVLWKNYDDVRKSASGGVQPNLNLSLVRAIHIALPPLAEQTRIVCEVERRLSVIEELQTAVTNNVKRAAGLRQSILRRAFYD